MRTGQALLGQVQAVRISELDDGKQKKIKLGQIKPIFITSLIRRNPKEHITH